MANVFIADPMLHVTQVRAIFWEYLEWANSEIKRMYVRPEYRRMGLGKALLEKLLAEADQIGYEHIRLDSARFMVAAHQLYRSFGFREIDPYEGSEIPPDFQKNWIFMRR